MCLWECECACGSVWYAHLSVVTDPELLVSCIIYVLALYTFNGCYRTLHSLCGVCVVGAVSVRCVDQRVQ